MTASTSTLAALLNAVADLARTSAAFAAVETNGSLVTCTSLTNPEAAFRLEPHDKGGVCITWVTANRYLSQSIEADLMWTGDDLDELIDEELADAGYTGQPLTRVDHFRNEEKLFTFRSVVPGAIADLRPDDLVKCLLAYNAAFAELGDMKPDEDE